VLRPSFRMGIKMGFTYYKTMLMIADTTALEWDDFFAMLKAEFSKNPAKSVEKISDSYIFDNQAGLVYKSTESLPD